MIDKVTRAWIRNEADRRAAEAGCRFDPERGQFVCDWVERYCYLYEGDRAGRPIELIAYQRDFLMRLFGWVRRSEEHGGEWIRRFTRASLWCPKKQGKSPTLAAIGLYLLCGEGEQGQKVYAGAKNGDQARIAQQHAYAMVEQSPELRAVCKLNASTLRIVHIPTRSAMLTLTGDDSRGFRAKEGINGSILIDECHVFDREMHERTSRAGISRREPLNLAVSTAGDDPSSYGFERFEYGRQVNAGDRNDPGFLHVEYSAEQKPGEVITDAQIDERLEELGRKANPAWGVIVKPSEFRADWESSKGKPREVARFRQYRLNLWVGSTNAWLDTGGWDKGRRSFTLEDMRGRSCVMGLDLSRTRDMTSAVFLFPWDEDGAEVVRLWPTFWLPEQTAKNRDHLFPFRGWAEAGELTLTPGEVVNYAQVESDIIEAVRAHDLRVCGVYFDQWNAEELSTRLADALWCERVAVRQGWVTISPLAKEFERRVCAGLVHHAGNAVMDWQVGHVQVKADHNRNIQPVKPDGNTGKSIDGVMSALDAMAGIVSGAAGVSDEPSIRVL